MEFILHREIIDVFPGNHVKPTNTYTGQNAEHNVQAGGTTSDYWSLQG
jgi:hypothetical protein